MKAALIVMTILGCDDSATQCHYVATVDRTWQSVAVCDAASEKQLNNFSDKNYPMMVAVCETSGKDMTAEAAVETPPVTGTMPDTFDTSAAEKPGIASRAITLFRNAVPGTDTLKSVVTGPVHYIEDGYSWVARKFKN
ncbi:hypothetical protein [Pararhizobium sp.]|uniref:hypothetical protein n=1 Tax=Pararhizobium sp. TaxID=1977563 RepID=UPI00271A61A8|nr:hypothetical protein [Pararhizobium sp.]MDO9417097.1 hypothetical protein [Pararhizobium sp.]